MPPSGVTLSVLRLFSLDELALTLLFPLRAAVWVDGVPDS